MCYDELEVIGAAVRACEKAKEDMERFFSVVVEPEAHFTYVLSEKRDGKDTECALIVDASEVRDLLELRMKRAAARLQEVGFRGPLAKAAPADAAETTRVLNAR